MSDLNLEEEKIPFDSEPIERKPSKEYAKERKRLNKDTVKSKSRAITACLLVLCVAFVGIVGYSLFSFKSQIAKLKSERNNYTMNISSNGTVSSYATAKGMLSTVSISANSYVPSDSSNNEYTGDKLTEWIKEKFFGKEMASRGSGIILEANKETGDAYIITNAHVVCTSSTVVDQPKAYKYMWVMLWDSVTPIQATYVGGSRSYDIAVLKITGSEEVKNSSCVGATIEPSSALTIGESVVAIGNSMARNLRISTGVVAVEEELMGTAGSYSMYISHSADVNSGNSGGGLYNGNGNLIGIVNAKFKDVNDTTGSLIYNEIIHGMNYAIPSDIAVSLAKNIIRNNGTYKKVDLGLVLGSNLTYSGKNFDVNELGQGYTTYNLIYNQEIESLSLKFWNGDVLKTMEYTNYAGETVVVKLNRLFSLESNVFNIKPNTEVIITVERSGIDKTIKLTAK